VKTATMLWIFTLNYSPEPTGFAPHAAALAEYFAAHGHQVTVLTGFPFAPRWKRWAEYRGAFIQTKIENGVNLTRVSHFIPRQPGSSWQRMLMEASFCLAAFAAVGPRLLRRKTRPDAVLYIGAQPAIAMLARTIGWLSGAPYFVNINDLAAHAATDVGILRPGRLQRLLERFEFAAYLPAAGATVLCRAFAQALVARGYPADRTRVIRSPIDVERIRPVPFNPDHRRRLGIPADAFVVLSAGSMGLKQGLANVVEAARRQRDRGDRGRQICWVLVGDGETRADLEHAVSSQALGERVRVLPFQPEEQMSDMFAAADALLLNQLASVKDTVIPSKLLTYMAAGRPVLAAVNEASQGAEILVDAGGGLLVTPEDPDALVRGVESMMQTDTKVLAEMGKRNRLYAERHFDRRHILAEHESFILERLAQLATRHAPVSA
jgi:colanic acid biosynthesis glycosyl transferase WcaI